MYKDTFPWLSPSSGPTSVLSQDMLEHIRPMEYIRRRYEEALAEVPYLEGESALEKRRREISYLSITWFMSSLLDRKDRMSMASGLEVRVPFCDHILAGYIWNVPWEMKTYGGMEKGLLRHALKDCIPEEILRRKKSPYPKTHNPSYTAAITGMMTEILNDRGSPLLMLADKDSLERNVRDLDLGITGIRNAQSNGRPWFGQLMAAAQLLAYLIQVDIWLRQYKITII